MELQPTEERTAIRRAYAKRLKITNPEDDATGFARLRAAYEAALAYADADESAAYHSDEPPGTWEETGLESGWPRSSWQSLKDRSAAARPSPLIAEFTEAHASAQSKLATALESPTTDVVRLAALDELLSSPLLDWDENVQSTEAFLALLIVDHWPQSDILIKPVVAHFDWTIGRLEELDLDAEQRAMRKWICRRGRDLSFLLALSDPDHQDHMAYQVLIRPPQRTTLGNLYFPVVSPKRVATFLARVHRNHPTIAAELDSRTVEYWQQKLATPQVPTLAVWMSTIAAVGMAATVASWFAISPEVSGAVGALFGIPVVWAACHLALIYGYAFPRWWWERKGRHNAPPLLEYGWAPMSLILLLLVPLPSSPTMAGVVTALSLFTAWWAVIAGDAEGQRHHWPWFIRATFEEIPLGIVALLAAESSTAGPWWQMTSVWLAISFASCFGPAPMRRLWEKVNSTTRRRALLAATLACLAAIIFLWLGYADDRLHPWCFPAVAGPILLLRVAANPGERRHAVFRRLFIGASALVTAMAAANPAALPVLGTLLVASAAFKGLTAWLETEPPLSVGRTSA
jgi:hypothetical protein